MKQKCSVLELESTASAHRFQKRSVSHAPVSKILCSMCRMDDQTSQCIKFLEISILDKIKTAKAKGLFELFKVETSDFQVLLCSL